VHAHGVDVGAVEQGLVGGGIVGADALDQFILAKELARGRLGLGDGRRSGDDGGGGRRLGGSERVGAFEAQ